MKRLLKSSLLLGITIGSVWALPDVIAHIFDTKQLGMLTLISQLFVVYVGYLYAKYYDKVMPRIMRIKVAVIALATIFIGVFPYSIFLKGELPSIPNTDIIPLQLLVILLIIGGTYFPLWVGGWYHLKKRSSS